MQNAKFYDIEVTYIDGRPSTLRDFAGKVLLIVNTASKCGYTPQYAELEELYQKYKEQGFAVLGFPCNQFGGQEPGTDAEVADFCSSTFDVTFPLFSKVDVNGENAHPLFVHLKHSAKGLLGTESIKWNFTKFLIDGQGQEVERFAPKDNPSAIEPAVRELLARATTQS